MARFQVPTNIRRTTEETFRACGGSRRECIVIWTAKHSSPAEIVRAAHLRHAATAVMTEVDSVALYNFNLELMEKTECVVAQLHTHPGRAFHSSRDDALPVIHTKGLISIVVPDFGERGLESMDGWFAAEYEGAGQWRALSLSELENLVSWVDP